MYYYFASITSGQIDKIRDLNSGEYDEIKKHVNKVSKMLGDKNRIEPVLNAYKELTVSMSGLSDQLETTVAKTVQNKLSQFLFEFKKLLDNLQTDINRTFGDKSPQFNLFKKAQSDEYDNYMEYRIMYRLRNYDQHCGDIISRITAYINDKGQKSYRILMNRDNLLNTFHEWKPEEIDHLKRQEEYIEIQPYITKFVSCILRIFEKTMQLHINETLLDSCTHLINIANEFDDEDSIHIISSDTEINRTYFEQSEFPLNFTHLFIPLCKEILIMQFKNNAGPIKVLYYGNAFKNRLNQFAFEINKETAEKIASSYVMDLCGQRLIRGVYRIHLDTGDLYALCVDARIKQPEQKNVIDNFSKYLKVLCKE